MLVAEAKLKSSLGNDRLILYTLRGGNCISNPILIARAKRKNSFGQREVFLYVLELPVLSACYNISTNMKGGWEANKRYFRTRASSSVLWQQGDT